MALNRFFKNVATLGVVTNGDSLYLQSGNTAMLTNVDQSGRAAGGLAEVNVAREWMAGFGVDGAPFKAEINVNADSVFNYDAGKGKCYYNPEGGADPDICLKLRVTGIGQMYLVDGGQVTELVSLASLTAIESAVIVPTLRVGGSAEVRLENSGSATRPTLVEIGPGALLKSKRGVNGIVDQWGGKSVWDALTEAFTTVNLMGGEFDLGEGGTFTSLNWRAGLFNPRRLSRPLTIANFNVWPDVDEQEVIAVLGHPLITRTNTTFV